MDEGKKKLFRKTTFFFFNGQFNVIIIVLNDYPNSILISFNGIE